MRFFLLSILTILTISSCSSIEQISIDYMVPAEINFPETLRRVAVVNNTSDAKIVSSQVNEQGNEEQPTAKQKQYTGDGRLVVESLAQSLAKANYFDEVVICDSVLQTNHSADSITLLSQSEIKKLTEQLDADFIITVDQLKLKTSQHVEYIPEWQGYVSLTDVKVSPSISIYIPSRNNPLYTINAYDSIFWEKTGKTEGYVTANQITEKDIIKEASTFAGTVPMKHLLPSWKSVYRYLHVGGNVHMRDAMIYVREDNWKEAIAMWENAYKNTKKKKEKMRLANNISLGYEMIDDLDNSILWAENTQKMAYDVDKVGERDTKTVSIYSVSNYIYATTYLEELKKRKNDLSILNVQMKRMHEVF